MRRAAARERGEQDPPAPGEGRPRWLPSRTAKGASQVSCSTPGHVSCPSNQASVVKEEGVSRLTLRLKEDATEFGPSRLPPSLAG